MVGSVSSFTGFWVVFLRDFSIYFFPFLFIYFRFHIAEHCGEFLAWCFLRLSDQTLFGVFFFLFFSHALTVALVSGSTGSLRCCGVAYSHPAIDLHASSPHFFFLFSYLFFFSFGGMSICYLGVLADCLGDRILAYTLPGPVLSVSRTYALVYLFPFFFRQPFFFSPFPFFFLHFFFFLLGKKKKKKLSGWRGRPRDVPAAAHTHSHSNFHFTPSHTISLEKKLFLFRSERCRELCSVGVGFSLSLVAGFFFSSSILFFFGVSWERERGWFSVFFGFGFFGFFFFGEGGSVYAAGFGHGGGGVWLLSWLEFFFFTLFGFSMLACLLAG